MSIRLPVALLLLFAGVAFADAPASREASLYSRLGGPAKIASLVDATFEHVDLSATDRTLARDSWIARICALSGGGCHAELTTHEAPARLIEELRRAMRAQDVPLSARNELLDLLARR